MNCFVSLAAYFGMGGAFRKNPVPEENLYRLNLVGFVNGHEPIGKTRCTNYKEKLKSKITNH
jgi:hypothetical protein